MRELRNAGKTWTILFVAVFLLWPVVEISAEMKWAEYDRNPDSPLFFVPSEIIPVQPDYDFGSANDSGGCK